LLFRTQQKHNFRLKRHSYFQIQIMQTCITQRNLLFQHYATTTLELIIKIPRKCKKLTRQYCTEIVGCLSEKKNKNQCFIISGESLEKFMFTLHSHNTFKISNPFFVELIQM